jgi:hypothetical protein
MSLDFQVVHVRMIDNTRLDALSRLQIAAISSINQIGLSTQQIMKDKQCPTTAEEKRAMIQVAHGKGHFGQQSIFMQIWHNGFWWPQIRDEIRAETNQCIPCPNPKILLWVFRPRQKGIPQLQFSYGLYLVTFTND